MTKFKIGDKVVRKIDEFCGSSMKIGGVYTVLDVNCIDSGYIQLVEASGMWYDSNFELYTEHEKHFHADLIVQWANGAVIEQLDPHTKLWKENKNPGWDVKNVYRVKPKEVLPVTMTRRIAFVKTVNAKDSYLTWYPDGIPNVEVTVNPDTGEILKIDSLI